MKEQMKKNIVLAVCSLVLAGTIGLSLWEQSSNEQVAQENAASMEFAGKNMEETSTSTNLYMNYAEVEQDVEEPEGVADEGVATGDGSGAQVTAETFDDAVEAGTSSGPDATKDNLVSSSKNTTNGSTGKKSSKAPTITYKEVSNSTTQSGPKKSGKSKNRVVSNVSKTGEAQANRVVKNPEPLNYVEKIFANHGTTPVLGELLKKYQYPVEIGYSYDKNYDGQNEAGDFILNKVYDTEEFEKDSDDVKNPHDSETADDEEDQATDSDKVEQDVLQSDASGDAVVEVDSDQTAETSKGDIDKQEVSGDAIAKEQKRLEEYRKDIWKQIMQTKPVEVEIEKKVMKTTPVEKSVEKDSKKESDNPKEDVESKESADSKKESSSEVEPDNETSQNQENESEISESEATASGDVQTEASGDAILSIDNMDEPVVEKEEVAGYYIVRGKMREGSNVYVSDIEIVPVGVDGFDQIRLGEDGEFKDSIVLTEDVVDRRIKLYFTDGETVTEAATFTYSKDTVTPKLQWMEEDYTLLQSAERTIYCTKEEKLPVQVIDGESDEEHDTTKTVERIQYLYGTKHSSVTDLDNARIEKDGDKNVFALTMKDDFYGRLLFTCHDKAGNVSDIQSRFVLVDYNEPTITVAQDERCSAPYRLWVNVEEMGHIVSGIQTIQCVVDGNIYEVSESVVCETYTLDEGLDVPSKITFPIELADVGIHAISIRVRDYAGNETIIERNIEVTEPELVSIYMPKNFTIHIDPQQLAGREQIYSDNVELKNVSKFDVRVNIDNVRLNVNDEVSADGILKDCELYLIAPDTGEKIKLKKGENENVYSYRLPAEAVGDLANIRFVGTTTKGSDRLWKGSDISLSLQVSFVKWDEEETSQ